MNINSALKSDKRYTGALDAYYDAVRGGVNPLVAKDATNTPGYETNMGLQARSLEAPAKLLYPLTAILRRMIPRVKPKVLSKLLEWKVITAINTSSIWGSISEGSAGTVNKKSEVDKSATLKSLGIRDYVTYESQFYGADFQDIKSLAVLTNLQTLMTTEEDVIIGGNTAIIAPPVGPGTAVASTGVAGATLPNATAFAIKVSPLSLQGFRQSQLVGYDPFANFVGEGLPSLQLATATTGAGPNNAVAFTWPNGSVELAYNVWIQTAGAGTFRFAGTVTTNAFTLLTPGQISGAIVENVGDGSANALDYDGIVKSYISGGSAYVKSLDNAALTSDGLGGVTQLTDANQEAFKQWGVGPNAWIMNPIHLRKIISLIAGSTAPVYRIDLTDGNSEVKGGMAIKSLLNPFVSEDVELVGHRTIPPGLIIGLRLTNPYDYANLANALDMAVVQDYYQVDYAVSVAGDGQQPGGRVWPFGVYVNEVLRVYFAGGGVILKNVSTS